MQSNAKIRKEIVVLKTYPFSDPGPVAQFGRLYPYNRFDGYSLKGADMEWEMVVLENDYIKLWINPAVGGKIWGAVEKTTGKEFIYFNHAAKFRDVAMRGPWTSGGIETNMGIIGHAPSCSSPVDYFLKENSDGSVCCFIGTTDWSSRTAWRVEICLPPNTPYFITRTSLFNNTPAEQSYYQWTNAGIKVSGNLTYVFPGDKRIGHDGKVAGWPVDEGIDISTYSNNEGEYKSYHVFGSYCDFWGCYWHEDDFGMAHYAAYHEKPGRKIWIWGLSRYGMIWEDLLTDADGQYTEVQSGRMFNQSIATSSQTPFKHRSFLPYTFDQSDEYWFPVKQLGGLTYTCPQLSFHITKENSTIHICANQPLHQRLTLQAGDQVIVLDIQLATMETGRYPLPASLNTDDMMLILEGEIIYNAGEQSHPLNRPVKLIHNFDADSGQGLYLQAKEWERQRFYEHAIEKYRACLAKDPCYIPALNGYAGVQLRHLQYDQALEMVRTALSIDTYDPQANYLYGLVNCRLGNLIDAKDGFSVATQSVEYRVAAYVEMSKMYLVEKQFLKAGNCLTKSLEYNSHNRTALQLKIVLERLRGNNEAAAGNAKQLLKTDPLDHLCRFELCLLQQMTREEFTSRITSELPHETHLELAAFYFGLASYADALSVLGMAAAHPMVDIWKAYLLCKTGEQHQAVPALETAALQDPFLVFPHRSEEITLLEWAVTQHSSWKFKYYLALCYRQLLRYTEAWQLLESCGHEPGFYPFYLVRAELGEKLNSQRPDSDLLEANRIAPAQWRTSLSLSEHYIKIRKWEQALEIARTGYAFNPGNYYLGLQLAGCLLHNMYYEEGIALMNQLRVLPNEGASRGRIVWRETHVEAAIDCIKADNWKKAISYVLEARRWPENMGLGKPAEVDERLEDFLEYWCRNEMNHQLTGFFMERIAAYRDTHPCKPFTSGDFLTILLLYKSNDQNKASLILHQWRQKEPDSLALHWSTAFYNNDKITLVALQQQEIQSREPLPYEIIVEDRDYNFIKKLYGMGLLPNIS